jgi:hypothetical protein
MCLKQNERMLYLETGKPVDHRLFVLYKKFLLQFICLLMN